MIVLVCYKHIYAPSILYSHNSGFLQDAYFHSNVLWGHFEMMQKSALEDYVKETSDWQLDIFTLIYILIAVII